MIAIDERFLYLPVIVEKEDRFIRSCFENLTIFGDSATDSTFKECYFENVTFFGMLPPEGNYIS